MNMQLVSSSRIHSIGWENDTLYIKFPDGALYEYDNVTKSEYESFMNSSSLGSSLSRLDKIHTYRRV